MLELNNIYNMDCLEGMKLIEDNSIDAIVTDPPYGISFMGKKWDYDVPKVEVWKEALRVLKPGGHILCACGTRTQHRMAVNLEDAGFEIRDIVAWIYGSGFPKSLNIGKAVDKLQGNEREVVGKGFGTSLVNQNKLNVEQGFRPNDYYNENIGEFNITKGNSEWEGWGTALKPAMELFTLARKPLSEKTVAENVLKWGTGGINIDDCRVSMSQEDIAMLNDKSSKNPTSNYNGKDHQKYGDYEKNIATPPNSLGRFPANLIHDGSDEVLEEFAKAGETKSSNAIRKNKQRDTMMLYGDYNACETTGYSDKGTPARFYYCAKASKSERGEGNTHPTVKPIKLIAYLIKLITPEGGIVLDPFVGSGTTALSAINLNKPYIGFELDKGYYELACKRINDHKNKIIN